MKSGAFCESIRAADIVNFINRRIASTHLKGRILVWILMPQVRFSFD